LWEKGRTDGTGGKGRRCEKRRLGVSEGKGFPVTLQRFGAQKKWGEKKPETAGRKVGKEKGARVFGEGGRLIVVCKRERT